MNQRPGRRLRRLSMRGAALLAGLLAAGALAHTAQASTLQGGGFVAGITPGHVFTVACGPAGFTYHAEGTSVGTHAGSFTEDGTVVFNPLTDTIVSLDATFTISSQMGGNVTGEKRYVGPGSEPVLCVEDFDFVDFFTSNLCYRAEFADGSPPETGRSNITMSGPPHFNEQFFPDATVSCGACPDEEDEDGDGLSDSQESRFLTVLGNDDSDFDGVADGNDDANGNGDDDEDEDDDENDGCPDEDSDDDGEDDEDEDDDEDDDD